MNISLNQVRAEWYGVEYVYVTTQFKALLTFIKSFRYLIITIGIAHPHLVQEITKLVNAFLRKGHQENVHRNASHGAPFTLRVELVAFCGMFLRFTLAALKLGGIR